MRYITNALHGKVGTGEVLKQIKPSIAKVEDGVGGRVFPGAIREWDDACGQLIHSDCPGIQVCREAVCLLQKHLRGKVFQRAYLHVSRKISIDCETALSFV